jgi:hypothetical protein
LEKVIMLRYEDLVNDQEKEMKRIFRFLGVEEKLYHHDVQTYNIRLEDYKIDARYKERFRMKYDDLNRPLNNARVNAWQSKLSGSEIAIIEAICGKLGSKLGYQPVKARSFPEVFFLRLKNLGKIWKANVNIRKERMTYALPLEMKLKRLKQAYERFGLG